MAKIGRFNLRILFYFFLEILFFTNIAYSANIKTEVSQNQVEIGDVFTVSIQISFSKAKPNFSIYEIPKDPKISFLRQSEGFSSQVSIINGVAETKKTVSLNMIFYAKEAGKVNIPNIKLQINSRVFNAKGFAIEVLKKSSSAKNFKNRNRKGKDPFSSMESLFNDFFKNNNNFFGNSGSDANLDFFIDVETSNMNPYYSEQFVAKWYLYTNGRVADNIDTLKYPTLEGFWKDEIALPTNLIAESVERNGRIYTRYLLASYALTPIVRGQAIIDPYEVKCQLFGGMFSFGGKELVRKSDEALIKIKPLPELKPSNFTGAVGNFQVSSFLQDQYFKVGQPFSYVIRVFGEGQLKFMELPELNLSEGQFSVYDTTEESQFSPPLKSIKTYKVLVVPQKSGNLVLPELELSFFEPDSSKFYTLKTKPISINVEKGDEVNQDIVSVTENKEAQIFKPDIYTDIQPSFSFLGFLGINESIYICLFAFLVSLILLVLKYFKLQVTYSFEKELKERFEHLEVLVSDNKWREASTYAVNIVYLYANAKTKRRPKSQRLEDILAVLLPTLRREIEASILDLNEDLQKYSFAPDGLISGSEIKDKVFEKSLALKALLERSSNDGSES